MPQLIDEDLCARVLIAQMKELIGVEPNSDVQTNAQRALRAIIQMHCGIAPPDYVSQLQATVEGVALAFQTLASSSGDVAAIMDEAFPVESSVQ